MVWAIINIICSSLAAFLTAYLLSAHGDRFNIVERVGAGVMGAAMILTIGPILSTKELLSSVSPFDDWSSMLLRIGASTFMIGVILRLEGYHPELKLNVGSGEGRIGKWRHARRNRKAARLAQRHLERRGKL